METVTRYATDPAVLVAVGVAAATAWYVLSPSGKPVAQGPFSVEVPGTARPGHGAIRRHPKFADRLRDFPEPDLRTCYDMFIASHKRFKDKNCYGSRRVIQMHKEERLVNGEKKVMEFPELSSYEWVTYDQVLTRATNFSSGLCALGMKPKDFLAVFEETRLEWSLTARAAAMQSISLFTVYSNLGSDALVFALNQGEVEYMVANASSAKLLAQIKDQVKSLKTIVYIDAMSAADKEACEKKGLRMISFEETEKLGAEKPIAHRPPKPEDIACIMYTSGSTGVPKGVLISHANFVSFCSAAIAAYDFKQTDRIVHFLPLAHSMAYMVEIAMLYTGVSLHYGNPRTVSSLGVKNCLGDIAETRPTCFVAVPAIFERIKHAVTSKVEGKGGIVQKLFNFAYDRKLSALKSGSDAGFWDRLVFAKVRKELGLDAVRIVLSGSAPLNSKIQDWVRVVLNAPMIQGYGLTETCSCGTLQSPEDVSGDTCGAPTAASEIKLVDIPDLGYLNSDKPNPRGEIWIRSPTVTQGYYKAKDKTDEVFFKDSDSPYTWFATGDVGMWLDNGNLRIIDRKKNLIKPPHGEYIALEKLESVYKTCPWLAFLMVYVDGTHYDCVLIGVPNAVMLLEWAKANNIPNADNLAQLCQEPAARRKVLDELVKQGRALGLKSIELIRSVHLTHEEWTPQNSMLTAAMKLNRTVVVKKFQAQIDGMYAELDKAGKGQ